MIKEISKEEANRLCKDVQLCWRGRGNTDGWRKDYDWFVEVEPNREEYTPKHLSNEVATKRESATTRCDHG